MKPFPYRRISAQLFREHRLISVRETPGNQDSMESIPPSMNPDQPPVAETLQANEKAIAAVNGRVNRLQDNESRESFASLIGQLNQSFLETFRQRFMPQYRGQILQAHLQGALQRQPGIYSGFKREWAQNVNVNFASSLNANHIVVNPGMPDHTNYMWDEEDNTRRELTSRENQTLRQMESAYNQAIQNRFPTAFWHGSAILLREGGRVRAITPQEIDGAKQQICLTLNAQLDRMPWKPIFRLYPGTTGFFNFSVAWNGVDQNLRPLSGPQTGPAQPTQQVQALSPAPAPAPQTHTDPRDRNQDLTFSENMISRPQQTTNRTGGGGWAQAIETIGTAFGRLGEWLRPRPGLPVEQQTQQPATSPRFTALRNDLLFRNLTITPVQQERLEKILALPALRSVRIPEIIALLNRFGSQRASGIIKGEPSDEDRRTIESIYGQIGDNASIYAMGMGNFTRAEVEILRALMTSENPSATR